MKIKNILICLALPLYLGACSDKSTNTDDQMHDQSEDQMHDHNEMENHDHEMEMSAEDEEDMTKSLPKEEHAMIDGTHFTIKYTAPVVKNRVIFGGLVAYDEVWVTGAHRATSIEFDKDISIGGTVLPAGKYAIFTIPGQNEWTVIFNSDWDQHLADDYNQENDLLRITTKPIINDEIVERLNYSLNSADEGRATLSISWEKVKIEVPIETAW
ncbi:DUF2911 domain-containing protein [Fulvivirgaceae bacterium LMO-SS25]